MAGLFDSVFSGVSGVAETLLGTLGITCNVHLKPSENYNPATGETVSDEAEIFTVKCSPPANYQINEIDGTNILNGDIKLIIGAAQLKRAITTVNKERLERSTIEINGEYLTVVSVEPIYSGELISAYKLQLRR
jgi:hypothetical protein